MLALVALGGCNPSATYVGLLTTSGSEASTVTMHGFDSASYTVLTDRGTLDRAAGKIDVQSLKGDTDASMTSVSLTGGGQASITDLGHQYVAAFTAQPASGPPVSGIFGVTTVSGDMPSGSASYTGTALVQIFDGTFAYDLAGTANVSADFRNKTATIMHDQLAGSRTDGTSSPVPVSDVATLTVSDAVISGAGISGGTAKIQSTELASFLSGLETVDLSAGFYGPSAQEVGGVLVIDDSANGVGSLLVFSRFAAE